MLMKLLQFVVCLPSKKIEFLHPKMGFKTHKLYCGHKGVRRATTINFKKYLISYHNSAITLYLSYLQGRTIEIKLVQSK